MSASSSSEPLHELKDLSVEQIDANPNNPRLIFPPEELDRLAESIASEGILVPVVVFPRGDRYVLIDGERRYKCALTLGLTTVPAVITTERTDLENLLQMFNIHLVREPWRDMPTAWALKKLIDELDSAERSTTDKDLAELTGMSRERIVRLRHALKLPDEYQSYINEGTIPLNWFWELHQNVIQPLASRRPSLFADYGEDAVREAFVGKRLSGIITDTVSLRDVRPIVNFAAKDAEEGDGSSVLDDTIRQLIEDPDLSIDMAYEDTVQIMVEVDKLQRSTENMLRSFERLFMRVRGEGDKEAVQRIGKALVERLTEVLSENE